MNTDYTEYNDIILPLLRERLSEKKIAHVMSTAQMSVEICRRIGRDDLEKSAYIASLLHDITREESKDRQLGILKDLSVLTEDDLKYPDTLHQLTGAALARELIPELADDDVCAAIACHCTGRPAMRTLDKILFLADYIEPLRKYDSSKKAREAFFRDGALTRAVILTLDCMTEHLKDKINKRTLQTYSYYKDKRKDKSMENLTPKELAFEIVKILDKKNAADIKLLHVGDKTVITDYFVLCSGMSNTQVRSYADEVEYQLGERGIEAHHIEGFAEASWIVLDYVSVVVHAFHNETRSFYGLEKVWADAEEIDISSLITEK